MEIGETTREGALRETLEEARARVALGPLFTMIDVPYIEQVHVFFRAELLDLEYGPGAESLEVRLFAEAEIPWQELAFRTVSQTLQLFFADRARGEFGMHVHEIETPARFAQAGSP
jgi:ADP-ribose pyrophosphatase YjhB (NUDIX family)